MSKRSPEKRAPKRATTTASKTSLRRRWTPEEDATLARVTRMAGHRRLRVNWAAVLAALPGRSHVAILSRRKVLGIGSAGRRWTAADDKLLRDRWGEDAGRTLARKLNRSEASIYIRAQTLKLPAQSQGRESVAAVGRVVGMWHDTLYRLLAECGLRAQRAAPVRQHTREPRKYAVLTVESEAVEALSKVRDNRTQLLSPWARGAGVCSVSALHRMRRSGLVPASSGFVRYPIDVLVEADRARGRAVAAGPWVDLWRAVLALGDIPCAPWVMALAAWDIAHGGAEWIEHLPQPVATVARRVAAGVRRPA